MKPELSITTRSSLLERLKNLQDHESWREFHRIYSGLIKRLVLKAGLTEHEAEDVLQEVLASVARNIGGFKHDRQVSSFRRWLSIMVRWRIHDRRKWLLRQALLFECSLDGSDGTGAAERVPDPSGATQESSSDAEWKNRLVKAALARVKPQVNHKDYQIFYLSVLKEKSVEEICRRLRVNRGQVYLAKHRVTRLMQKEIKKLKAGES